MKKIVLIIVSVLMCMSICSCGASNAVDIAAVESELNGSTWAISNDGGSAAVGWAFVDGRVSVVTNISGLSMSDTGNYTVTKKSINFTWDDPDSGRVDKMYFIYENGDLILYSNKGKTDALNRMS